MSSEQQQQEQQQINYAYFLFLFENHLICFVSYWDVVLYFLNANSYFMKGKKNKKNGDDEK
jgi:hypothetical protein